VSKVSTEAVVATPQQLAESRFVCMSSASGAHATWVYVAGELDIATAPELQRELQEAQLWARLIVIDLRAVTFIDCSGLHVLIAARAGGARTMLVAGHAVNRLLELAGVADQVSTIDLDPSEPAPALGLAPDRPGGSSGGYESAPLSARPNRTASGLCR
jgi:anti-anti-sigma factor